MEDIELPDLPEGAFVTMPNGWRGVVFDEEQMRAYALADREKRAPTASNAGERDEKLLRKLLAIRVAGAALYGDDGELQDNSVHPCIDFKRDSAEEIERKLLERGTANAWKSIGKYAALAQVPEQVARDRFEQAMKQTWQMIDPLRPPVAGSYALGEHNGIAAALKTLRENYERAARTSGEKSK